MAVDDGECKFEDIADAYGDSIDRLTDSDDDKDQGLGNASLCSICDDGGHLLMCDGPCMRSFHATKDFAASTLSQCRSLGLKPDDIKTKTWYCLNCKYGKQQCSICGLLGRSKGENKEVFVCDVALCGKFYHAHCLVAWKAREQFNGVADPNAFIKIVKQGKGFCCPVHICRRCGEGEEECSDNSMKLVKCLRCPKAFHKICLPPRISFKAYDDKPIRAWDVGSRLLMYCMKHEILPELLTPGRDHLVFPEPPKKLDPVLLKRKHVDYDRKSDMIGSSVKLNQQVVNREVDVTRMLPRVEEKRQKISHELGKTEKEIERVPITKAVTKNLVPQGHRRLWIMRLLERAKNYITVQDVKQAMAKVSCYGERRDVDQGSSGEIISTIIAGKKALDVINAGGTAEFAKRLFPKESLTKLLKTEKMLRVYLAPLVHGKLYTSFGRHFTQIDKLKEIVKRIHPYIDDGDMVVDFCCGSNDFSVLLNRKLRSTGKSCEFRNFDIHPPKDTFCFTRGDWFEQNGVDFLKGRRLIMGLNPPFGFHASLADKFIIHALKFRPKLLVLIVPPETMSFSEKYKDFDYHQVWVDDELLKGSSFYFPGSVDQNGNEKVPQWNNITPHLYLWSPAEIIGKHKEIAYRLQHIRDPPTRF